MFDPWRWFSRTRQSKRRIHLTFDDGPNPLHTPVLLDELKQAGILATFFVVGKKLETPLGQGLIQRAAADGHQIGNHTYSHPHLTELTGDQIREEIVRTEKLIGNADRGVKLLRPPFGHHNSLVDQVAQELGYHLVLWNVDSYDWHLDYQSRWVNHAMKQIETEESSIVLAHDNLATTVAKVGTLIAQIRELSDSNFISSSEAFSKTDVEAVA
jgi:peptidoglycan-N-acetylglucosamine deacetylase